MISPRLPVFFQLLIFSLLMFGNNYLSAQTNHIYYLDSIPAQVSSLDDHWLYHPGDNPDFSQTDFPDQSWDTLATVLNLDGKDESFFPGIAWFRLHIKIDTSLFDKIAAISIGQRGASQIFWNGKLIKEIGVIGNDSLADKKRNPKNVPVLLEFDTLINNVLAVRYFNRNAYDLKESFNYSQAGFTIYLSSYDAAINAFSNQVVISKILLALFFVFLVLGGLHFLLYLFFRKNAGNLYYSIFVVLFALMIFWSYAANSYLFYPDFVTVYMYFISLLFPWVLVPLVKLLYFLFFNKTPKFFYIIISLAALGSIFYYFNFPFISYFYAAYAVIVIIEIIRVAILAILKNMNGGWILGTGVIFFILFFLSIVMIVLFNGGLSIDGGSFWGFVFLISIMLAILSIPISMSVFLARDFAITNKNLNTQLENVKILSAKSLEQEKDKQRILEGQKEKLEVMVTERTKELEEEKDKTEKLLLNTLPLKVVNELKANGVAEPESFDNVTVYFSDIVGFTNISTQLEPAVLIGELNKMFTAFDDIMEHNNCERIKTIGDAYLAVCGMPDKVEQHAERMAEAALQIKQYLNKRNKDSEIEWKIRIGLHSGAVVGGIVGVRKYIYDVFGDTINTSSRMESNSEAMRINVSETTFNLLKEGFEFTPRDPIEIKGKGMMKMYFLERKK